MYGTYYNLLIGQDLWQVHCQILPIIFLKEFINVNCKFGHNDEKFETCGIKNKYCNFFFEYTNFKIIY